MERKAGRYRTPSAATHTTSLRRVFGQTKNKRKLWNFVDTKKVSNFNSVDIDLKWGK